MLSEREAELDAKIFRLILEDIRSEMSEEDQQDKLIEVDDINACSKAGSFLPISDRDTDLAHFFVEILGPSAVEGSEAWCHVADDAGPEGPDYYNSETIPPGIANEITAGIARVLASAHLAAKQQKAATIRLVGLGKDLRPS